MSISLKETSLTLLVGLALFSSTMHANAGCNAPNGQGCNYTVVIKDGSASARKVSTGGTLQMVRAIGSPARSVSVTATALDGASFDTTQEPDWYEDGTKGMTTITVSTTEDKQIDCDAFYKNKTVHIDIVSKSPENVEVKTGIGFDTLNKVFENFAGAIGVGGAEITPMNFGGSYKGYNVDFLTGPTVERTHELGLGCSGGIKVSDVPIPGLFWGKTIMGVELKAGVSVGSAITISLSGDSKYDGETKSFDESKITAKVQGSLTGKLEAKLGISKFAGGGVELNGTSSIAGTATGVMTTSGFSITPKLSWGVSFSGEAYYYVGIVKHSTEVGPWKPDLLNDDCTGSAITFSFPTVANN